MSVTTTTIPTSKGDSATATMRMQVSDLKKQDIDPADFEVPAGYNTMDMREMMKNMDPSMLSGAIAGRRAQEELVRIVNA